MRYKVLFIIVMLLNSCVTTHEFYTGSLATRYGINPFPGKEEWVNSIKQISKKVNNNSRPALLWNVGTYLKNGIKLSFPGKSESNNHYFTEIDLNSEYFKYFSNKKIDVFLIFEPGVADISETLKLILGNYSSYKSVKGICIDLEWYDINKMVTKEEISKWLTVIHSYNPKYKLIIKHWNINMIESFNNKNLIFLQNMDNIENIDEFIKRYKLWARKFYPNRIGLKLGSDYKKMFDNLNNPTLEIYQTIKNETNNSVSLFWSENVIFELSK
ncbi:MAG: hypothetical protein JXR64_10180 [Spirochaetales bacterium]|nr:hypothetical protein [Spirochaetales bacterium]